MLLGGRIVFFKCTRQTADTETSVLLQRLLYPNSYTFGLRGLSGSMASFFIH